MKFPRVSIIILNWNGWKDTIECLESLYRITYPNYDVIVVDNGSKDDSVQKIKDYCKGKIKVDSKFFDYDPSNKPIKVFEIGEDEARRGRFNRPLYEKFEPDRRMILIKNKDNYGFTGGNNIGIKFALSVLNPKCILLLNNDTVVDRLFLINLIKNLYDGAILSPTIYDYNNDKIQYLGERINWYYGKIKKTYVSTNKCRTICGIVDSDTISGACVLIPREVILEIGGLKEELFILWEDIEYSLRARQQGFVIKVVFPSKIWHKGSVSIGKIYKSPIRIKFSLRNRIWVWREYATKLQFYIFIISYLFYIAPYHILLGILLSSDKKRFIRFGLDGIRMGLFT